MTGWTLPCGESSIPSRAAVRKPSRPVGTTRVPRLLFLHFFSHVTGPICVDPVGWRRLGRQLTQFMAWQHLGNGTETIIS